ncbi:unnamed protein product [Lathyrus sativus]|nr:unnamed protein product [Lathyrus sativus]
MATSFAPLSISVGGSHLKSSLVGPKLAVQRKSNFTSRKNLTSPLRAEYRDNRGGGGGELLTGFLLGGAIFGTLAYVFAPQIRRTVLDENEHGFRRATKPIYYEEEIERTSETSNDKIGQLLAAIDSISPRLNSNNKKVAKESDPEVEAI